MIVVASLVAVALALTANSAASAQGGGAIAGSGSWLPNLIMQQWRVDAVRQLGLSLAHTTGGEGVGASGVRLGIPGLRDDRGAGAVG